MFARAVVESRGLTPLSRRDGVDDDRSIVYQLRSGAPDGPVVKEGFLARSINDWEPLGDGKKYVRQFGHPVAFGVPKGALIGGKPAAHGNVFVAKCAALLQKGVAVSIVDLVTVRHFNLYVELLAVIGHTDPTLGDPPPDLYAASCRWTSKGKRALLEAWSHVLTLGRPLPTLPLWLTEDLVVPLDLEKSYEQACSDLWIA